MITLEVKEQDEIGLTVNGSTMPMPDEYCVGGSLLDKTVTGYFIKRGVTEIRGNKLGSLPELEAVDIPDSVQVISGGAFANDYKLKKANLPKSLRLIEAGVFHLCYALELEEIPAAVEEIGSGVFYHCDAITRIVFRGTPTTIHRNAFDSCRNLNDIYVPWNEGEVANAPWGATHATIHYGYTGE